MKKQYIFMAAAAAIALASCTSEDMLELNTEDAISFRAAMDYSSSSRGDETTTSNLLQFNVTALEHTTGADGQPTLTPLFENLPFRKNGIKFESDPAYKWSQKMILDFYAWGYNTPTSTSPMTLPCERIVLDKKEQMIYGYTPAPAIQSQIDLVGAKNMDTRPTAMGNSVGLNFTHLLSEVQVVARCQSRTHRVLVAGFRYGNVGQTGDYNYNPADGAFPWTLRKVGGSTDPEAKVLTTSYGMDYKNILDLNSTRYTHGTEEYHDISLTEGNVRGEDKYGFAILLPQNLNKFEKGSQYFAEGTDGLAPEGREKTDALYIAMLIRIEMFDQTGEILQDGQLKFPLTDDLVAYTDGDGRTYGWAYIPFYTEAFPTWEPNNRYIYHLDFSHGAGYTEDGDPILKGELIFNASVETWKPNEQYRPWDTEEK